MRLYTFLFTLITITQLSLSQTRDSIVFINFGKTKLTPPSAKLGIIDITAGNGYATYTTEDGSIHLVTTNETTQKVSFSNKKIIATSTSLYHTTVLFNDLTIEQCSFVPEYRMYIPTTLKNIKTIDAGDLMSIGISKKSYMYVWGKGNIVSKLNLPLKTYGVRQASVGKEHIVFINIKDRVFTFSNNGLNQKQIPNIKAKPIKVAAGEYHSLLLDEFGKVHSWGDNNYNQAQIPDFKNRKVIDIDANGLLSLAVLEDSSIVVWGANINQEFNLRELGYIKKVCLGKDFLAIHILKNKHQPQKINFTAPQLKLSQIELDTNDINYFAKKEIIDSLEFFINKLPNEQLNIKNNSYSYKNIGGHHYSENSSTNVIFEGNNNSISVINKNGRSIYSNSNSTIIFKGSGHNKQIIYNNSYNSNYNSSDTLVIDLDKEFLNEEVLPAYHEAYNNGEEQELNASNYIEVSEIPSSYIAEFPIYDGFYTNGDFYVPINEPHLMLQEINYLEEGDIHRAQLYFYLGQNEDAFKELYSSINDSSSDIFTKTNCHLALFEIYYYGLFNTPIDIPKATKHYNYYQLYHQK